MALVISIQQTPAKNLTYKMYPVYNGLPFMVYSNNVNRTNFKYIADIYVGGTKVTTLKQNKDISASNNGVFDIGRVVENFIQSQSPTFQTQGFAGDGKAYQSYQIKFGAEYERTLAFYSTINSGGYMRLQISSSVGSTDLRVGDRIFITDNNQTYAYNGPATVTAVGSASITLNKPFSYNANGNFIEGEGFYDNGYGTTSGTIGFLIPVTRPTRINVGDTVVVKQDAGATFPAYDGEWLVNSITTRNVSGINYTVISTNCPVLGNTPPNGGIIYSQNKYKFNDITTSTLEYAFDGALQYKELTTWNPTVYAMNPSAKGKFLTNAPNSQYIRLDESMTLTSFNTSIVGSTTKKGVWKTYNAAGVLQNTYSYGLGGVSLTTAVINMGVGVKNLLSLSAGALPSTIAYYTFELQDVTNVRVSEIRTFILDRQCFRYTQKRFKWKNRMGGWDYFTFNLRSDRTVNIERSNYRKVTNHFIPGDGMWGGTPDKYGYVIGNRGNSTYNVNARDSEIVFSNWLTNDEAAWLEELFTSPEAYVIDGTNALPIILTDTALKIGEKENRGLISYSINYDYANNKLVQRG